MKTEEEKKHIEKKIFDTARQNHQTTGADRPEVKWLQERMACIQRRYKLKSKIQVDRLLCERMLGREPRTGTESLKIRYWRTGRYTPVNREQCLRLAGALELTEEEKRFLIQGYFDRSETVYDTPEKWNSAPCIEKCSLLQKLEERYLAGIPRELLEELHIRPEERGKYFRHIYFTDAFHYVTVPGELSIRTLRKHITSTRYDSELRRQMRLQGEIPRRTMLRHLIILNGPAICLESVNEQLDLLGYLPLDREHTMTGGERLDALVIQLLESYREIYDPLCPGDSHAWLQKMCRRLDAFFAEQGKPRMRFMHFKALEL